MKKQVVKRVVELRVDIVTAHCILWLDGWNVNWMCFQKPDVALRQR